MAIMETLVKRKFKIKLTSTSAPIDAERKSCQNGSKAKVPVPSGCNKHKHELEVEDRKNKRRKMDPCVKRQCGCILDILLAHRHGFAFKSPVDPVALKIPDYFSIISHPMDLGTIKSKLAGNAYFAAEEFAADVKLTFSNAMLYNPPDNFVHHMAKELECIFLKRWKLLEAKWNCEMDNAQQGILPNVDQKSALDTGKACSLNSGPFGLHQRSTCPSSSLLAPITIATSGEDTGKTCYEKSHVNSSLVLASKASVSLEEKRKLKKDLMEILVGGMTEKLQSRFKKLGLQFSKKEIIDLEFDKFDDDVLWQLKSVLKDAKDDEENILSTNGTRSDRNSLGSVGDLDEESSCPRSNLLDPVTIATSGEGWTPVLNDEQDLKKALRAAMLKKRFAETISKANSDKADSRKVQQEIKRLQCEEEARIKALMRDEQFKKEAQRETLRKSARVALEMMKKTVEHEDNLIVVKELEKLCGCCISYESGSGVVLRDLDTGKVVNSLEQLGLRLKKDFFADGAAAAAVAVDDKTVYCEVEEGEILN